MNMANIYKSVLVFRDTFSSLVSLRMRIYRLYEYIDTVYVTYACLWTAGFLEICLFWMLTIICQESHMHSWENTEMGIFPN